LPDVYVSNISNNHWVTASNIGAAPDTINIYDSLTQKYSLDDINLFASFHHTTKDKITFKVMNVQKQHNSYDCGLYALAIATSLLHGQDPTQLSFSDSRAHLLKCYKNGQITPFPAKTEYRQLPVKVAIAKYMHCTCQGLDTESWMTGCEWVHNSCAFPNGEHSGD